jgi:hypothetical protein
MATRTPHRPAGPASVSLDFEVPPSLLTGDDLAPVRALHAAYLDARTGLDAALDEVITAADLQAENAAAIRSAVIAGKKPPAAVSEAEAEARATLSVAKVNDAARAAHQAGTAYEAALLEHRSAIRAALVPAFREADAEYADAQRVADAASARRSTVLVTLNTLDTATASAEQKAASERNHRFVNAVAAARTRLGETATVEADLLESQEYLLARKGAEAVAEVAAIEASLRASRDDFSRGVPIQKIAAREVTLKARLRALVPNHPAL